jgi:hypothetical protein
MLFTAPMYVPVAPWIFEPMRCVLVVALSAMRRTFVGTAVAVLHDRLSGIVRAALRLIPGPLDSRFLFGPAFCLLAFMAGLCPLLCRLLMAGLLGRRLLRPLNFCLALSLTLGLLSLLPGLQPPLLQLVLPSLLGLGNARLDLFDDALHLLFAQRPLHGGQQLALLVPGVLAEGLLQFLKALGEGFIVLRQRIEFGKFGSKFLVVLDRLGDQSLRLGVSPENWKKVLFLKGGMEWPSAP